VRGGNLLSDAAISATGDLTIVGFGSIQGNVIGGNVNSLGLVSSVGNVVSGNVRTAGLMTATGNITGGNIITGGAVSAVGNISAIGNVFGGNLFAGNTGAGYVYGNASFMTGIGAAAAPDQINNGSTVLSIATSGANIDGVVAGVSVLTVYTGGQLITG
jgi:hypothetical protein